jgi:Flp pilus assembly protein TadB
MMRAMEILYLVAAAFLAAMLVQQFAQLTTMQKGMLIGGIVIFSFMYSFRRSQRQRMEQKNNKDKD